MLPPSAFALSPMYLDMNRIIGLWPNVPVRVPCDDYDFSSDGFLTQDCEPALKFDFNRISKDGDTWDDGKSQTS